MISWFTTSNRRGFKMSFIRLVRSFLPCALLAFQSLLSARQEQPEPQADEKRIVATGQRYALIVGVGDAVIPGYKRSPLPGCLRDAKALTEILKKCGYAVTTLSENDTVSPNIANVAATLKRICAEADSKDQVMVYFTSHGLEKDGVPCIALKDGLMPLRTIKEELSKSKAIVRIVLLDCCRSEQGFRTESSEIRDVHIVLSCRPDETSTFGPSGLSAFTEVLVEALTDCHANRVLDDRIELDEVLYYLDEHVPKRAEAFKRGHKQNPTRTVVDPRSVNPILATCGTPAAVGTAVPTAVSGVSVLPAGRNDLIIPSAIVGKIRLGMTPKELIDSVGKPAAPFTTDQLGNGQTTISDTPAKGDELRVTFEHGSVSSVQYLRAVPCRESFDARRSSLSWDLNVGKTPDKEVTRVFAGMNPEQVFEKIGCSESQSLRLDPDGSGVVTYTNVPRKGSQVRVAFARGIVSHVSIARQWTCKEGFNATKAQAGFAKLAESAADDQLTAVFTKNTPLMVIEAMGCPSGPPLLLDESGSGTVEYRDVPAAGDLTTIYFQNDFVSLVIARRAVSCLSLPDAARSRERFKTLAAGNDDMVVADQLRSKTPAQVFASLGCPATPLRLDGSGQGTATYRDVPEAGDEISILFFRGKSLGVLINRAVK